MAFLDVTIQFAAIQEIKTDPDKELHVTLKDGKTAVGPVTTTNGKIEIATKTAGTVEAPKEDVKQMRSEEAYQKYVHPGLMNGWDGGIDVGFSIAHQHGNCAAAARDNQLLNVGWVLAVSHGHR